ncbi:sensor histidine kinase [Maribacter halichondriae]|uniref:sensor histidine kinase n=1 Tax=Maribacter halichondriae TaxID=2980554 RepID=UPI00235952B4|nr:HAMP domain-containing sensor histidine kinase [Maribacter sp. Hal144]
MLEKYRRQYRDHKVQFIFVDYDDTIVESDQTLFPLIAGSKLSEEHPFFESVSSLLESSDEVFKFFCIHLRIEKTSLITDITMIKKDEGFLLIIDDLSEHYDSYQSVAQSRNESIIKTELTVIKNQELEERERFKNSFIQNFSHELRSPLTGIMAISDILATTSLNGEQRKMLDFLKHSNSNLSLMLEDILNISSIGSGRLELQQKLFSLAKLFKLLEFTYKTKAKKKNLDFYCHLDEKVPEFVEGDRLRIYQVLTNLLDNAIKYTTKGNIKLSIVFNQKWANKVSLRFEVSDTANGIPQESFDTIFESFTQLNTENKANGSGLGLAIVKGLLKLMGSKIRLNSTVGEGSVFYFDLLLRFPLQTFPAEHMDNASVFVPERIKRIVINFAF